MNLIFVLLLLLPCVHNISCQDLPNINCDEEVAQTGKTYNEIYSPHEYDCNKFYQCTADQGLIQLKCLKGLVFFPYINGCVVRTQQNCIIWQQWRSLKH